MGKKTKLIDSVPYYHQITLVMSPVLYVMLKSSLAPLMLADDLLLMIVWWARIIFQNTEPSPRQRVQPSSHEPGPHGYQNCEK
jgi:hypothetical protein